MTAPEKKQIRQFGLLLGLFIAGVFGLFYPWLSNTSFPLWPWLALPIVWLITLFKLSVILFIYKPWMWLAGHLARINTYLILLLVYALLIIPTGLIIKLIAKDPMRRKLSPKSKSYRINSQPLDPKQEMESPF